MRILVSNTAGQRVARGGLVFAPRAAAREVIVTNTAYREIKACRALRILRSSTDDKTPFAQVDAEQELIVNEEAFLRPERQQTGPPAPPAPVKQTHVAPPETRKPRTAKPHPCPHCDFIAKKKSGLTSHINRHHPGAAQ